MKTSRVAGAILAVLALPVLRQLYHQTVVNVNSSMLDNAQDVTSTTSKKKVVKDQQSDKKIITEADRRIGTETEQYSFHEACPCQRRAPNLSQLERHFNASTVEQARRSSKPWKPVYGSYVGNSTCNRHFV